MTPYSSPITSGLPVDRRRAERRAPNHSRLVGIASRFGDTIIEAGPDGNPLPQIPHDASHRRAVFDAIRAPKLHAEMMARRRAADETNRLFRATVPQPHPVDEPDPSEFDLIDRCFVAVIAATSTGIVMIGVLSLAGWM